jgi:glucokinase
MRSPLPFLPNPDAPYVVGVDLGGTNLRAALADREGHILQDARRPSRSDRPAHVTLENLIDAVREVIDEQKVTAREVVGIGIGLPGIMDSEAGVVFWSPNFPDWHEVAVSPVVSQALRLPTTILNDARCAALGELQFGAGRGVQHMVMITLGTGIGGAFVVDGKLLLGPNGSIGEVGHQTLDVNGRRCGCGNFGCWEALCGRDAIVERALRLVQRGRATRLTELAPEPEALTPALIAQAAAEGDAVAGEVMAETGFYVGVGVANLINLLNPEVVVVGGAQPGSRRGRRRDCRGRRTAVRAAGADGAGARRRLAGADGTHRSRRAGRQRRRAGRRGAGAPEGGGGRRWMIVMG